VSDKVSDRLSSLLASEAPDKEVNLHVMLRDDLSAAGVKKFLNKLAAIIPDKGSLESLSLSKMVLCTVPLSAVQSILKFPEVVWVDVDSEASLESLIDPEP
jgi:hypothetical protein